ncbi:MAG: crosslink repair DNA glycosylase YcaQ family protein, partial [Actinomyces sp.]|uniref:DNA glycosylase AlkZ-like family protein n=1 Tax=Actinomyces sp. TaxID=29317 RepID=UPI0026DD9ED4
MPSTAYASARAAAAARPVHAPRELSLLRIVAQGLVPGTTAPTPAEAVRRQLAIQGQQPSAVPHALVCRVGSATRAEVEQAFEAGLLVRSWPMRGTVHITTAEDHHWLRVALRHRMRTWVRQSQEQFGMDDRMLERAADVALAAVAGGGIARAALLEAWERAGLMEPFKGEDVSTYRRRHLLVRLQLEGVLVQGPKRGNEHLVVDARGLPDADTGPGGAGGGAHDTDSHRPALAEIARRYATSHGPVTAADLARWTTLPLREAARALEDALEATNAAGYAVDPAAGHVPLTRATAEGGLRGTVTVLGPGTGAAGGAGGR